MLIYATLQKIYGSAQENETRYSPAKIVSSTTEIIKGNPNPKHISTSYGERQNLTMRIHIRRFTRLTNAFSMKLENHTAAVALHFVWYNFVRVHQTLCVTPAMEAGITDRVWSIGDIVGLLDATEEKPRKRRCNRAWAGSQRGRMTMVRRASACLAVLGLASIGWAAKPSNEAMQLSYAPTCRHGEAATQQDQDRRSGALALAKAINAAQAGLARASHEYQPVANLQNLPTVPTGFEVTLYTDRTGYMFSIKDTVDPCHFAVFSDSGGLVYQQSALDAPVVAQ